MSKNIVLYYKKDISLQAIDKLSIRFRTIKKSQ